MREILSAGLVRTLATLILGATSSLYVVLSASGLELSSFVVASVYIGFLSLGDFGLAPTLMREVAEKQSLDSGFGIAARQIKNVFTTISLILAPLMILSAIHLTYSRDLNHIEAIGFLLWCGSILLNFRFAYFEIVLSGLSFVPVVQTAQIGSKFISVTVVISLYQYLGEAIIFCYGLGAVFGSLFRVKFNHSSYNRLVDRSFGVKLVEKRALLKTAFKMGIYYQLSFAVSKASVLYLNLFPDALSTNRANILHQAFSFLFVFSSMPTTYLLPKYTSLISNRHSLQAELLRKTALRFFHMIVMCGLFACVGLLILSEGYGLLPYSVVSEEYTRYQIIYLFCFFSWIDERVKFGNSFSFAARQQSFLFRHAILAPAIYSTYYLSKYFDVPANIALICFIVLYIKVLTANHLYFLIKKRMACRY